MTELKDNLSQAAETAKETVKSNIGRYMIDLLIIAVIAVLIMMYFDKKTSEKISELEARTAAAEKKYLIAQDSASYWQKLSTVDNIVGDTFSMRENEDKKDFVPILKQDAGLSRKESINKFKGK